MNVCEMQNYSHARYPHEPIQSSRTVAGKQRFMDDIMSGKLKMYNLFFSSESMRFSLCFGTFMRLFLFADNVALINSQHSKSSRNYKEPIGIARIEISNPTFSAQDAISVARQRHMYRLTESHWQDRVPIDETHPVEWWATRAALTDVFPGFATDEAATKLESSILSNEAFETQRKGGMMFAEVSSSDLTLDIMSQMCSNQFNCRVDVGKPSRFHKKDKRMAEQWEWSDASQVSNHMASIAQSVTAGWAAPHGDFVTHGPSQSKQSSRAGGSPLKPESSASSGVRKLISTLASAIRLPSQTQTSRDYDRLH